MTKEVLLSITGLQMMPEDEGDTTEVIAPGEYYYRNNKHYIIYEEVVEGFSDTTKNTIKFSSDCVELTKKGVTNVHMVFEKGKKNMTYYYTPFGSLLIGIEATKIEITEEEEHLVLHIAYGLDVNYEHLADCDICVDVKQKGSTQFSLVK